MRASVTKELDGMGRKRCCYMRYDSVSAEWVVRWGNWRMRCRRSVHAWGDNQVGGFPQRGTKSRRLARDRVTGMRQTFGGYFRVFWYGGQCRSRGDGCATAAALTKMALAAATTPLSNHGVVSDVTAHL